MNWRLFLVFLFYFTSINVLAQLDLEWQRIYGGSDFDMVSEILPTADGGFVFSGYSKSDDGDLTINNGAEDIWIVKLDSLGNIEWQKTYGGSYYDNSYSMDILLDGYIVTGRSLSADGDFYNNNGGYDWSVLKLNQEGDLEWLKTFGTAQGDIPCSVKVKDNGHYVIAGSRAASSGDFNPSYGDSDGQIIELDEDGNLVWQKNYGGSNDDYLRAMIQSNDNGFVAVGSSYSFDIDLNNYNGGGDIWVLKTDSLGNVEWSNNFGGNSADFSNAIIQTEDDGYLITGMTLSDGIDFSGNYGKEDVFLLKLDANGNLQWLRNYGGPKSDFGIDVLDMEDGGYLVCANSEVDTLNVDVWLFKTNALGFIEWEELYGGSDLDFGGYLKRIGEDKIISANLTHSSDGDIANFYGYRDIWLLQFKEQSPKKIQTVFFEDQNANGFFDEDETGFENQTFFVASQDTLIHSSDENGYRDLNLYSGQYQVYTNPLPNWQASTPLQYNFTIETNSIFADTLYFGFVPIDEIPVDATLALQLSINTPPLVCGKRAHIWVNIENNGTTPITGQLQWIPNDDVVFIDSLSTPFDQISNDTLNWFYEQLPPQKSQPVYWTLDLPDADFENTELSFPIILTENSTEIVQDYTFSKSLICDYEPNQKTLNQSPYFLAEEPLEFTIWFSNLSNQVVSTLLIRDQLDEHLNWESFELLDYSHPVESTLDKKNGLLQFYFTNLNLPSSDEQNGNEVEQGFVKYQLKAQTNLPEFTDIYNTAQLYFDLNPMIQTNTVETQLVEIVPALSLEKVSISNPWKVFPNPNSGIFQIQFLEKFPSSIHLQIFDVNGLVHFDQEIEEHSSILNLNLKLNNGFYFIKIESGKFQYWSKIVIQK